MVLTNLKSCMSAHGVSSLLEMPCCLVPTLSFLLKIKNRSLHKHGEGKLFALEGTNLKPELRNR